MTGIFGIVAGMTSGALACGAAIGEAIPIAPSEVAGCGVQLLRQPLPSNRQPVRLISIQRQCVADGQIDDDQNNNAKHETVSLRKQPRIRRARA